MPAITDTSIRAAIRRVEASGSPATIKDPGHRGAGRLALHVRPGPVAEWYAVYYRQGRRQQAKLGNYPALSLSAARDLFRQEFAPAIASGSDPRAARREAARARSRQGTVADLFTAYVDHMKAAGRRSWREYERALLTLSYAAADALGRDRLASDVKPGDVAEYLGAIYRRGAASHADHIRSYMHAAFAWALKADHDYRQRAAGVRWGLQSNPVSAIPRDTAASQPGDRHLTPDELAEFWHWLSGRTCNASMVLRLQIATGQRVQMLAGLVGTNLHRQQRTIEWTGGQTKNGRPHVLPLPKAALDLLAAWPLASNGGLMFPQARNHDRPVTHFTVADLCREYCRETGAEPFTPRDIRRTWKTLAGLAGIDKEMRDRLQHHALHDVGSRHYDRYDYLPEKRAAMAKWSAWFDNLIGTQHSRSATVRELGRHERRKTS